MKSDILKLNSTSLPVKLLEASTVRNPINIVWLSNILNLNGMKTVEMKGFATLTCDV